ncbi:MAG: CHASE2 domain-containing protein [Chloroflexi bacterium]|nr:CHASE2 domain-containing protein [Chloroflexota bacterium]
MKNKSAAKPSRHPRLRAALLALLIAALLLSIEAAGLLPGVTTPIEKFELASGDQRFRLRGALPLDAPIVIVAIDDFSFSWSGLQWPWPRDYLAKVLAALDQDGAAVIGLDILLTEPSPDPLADEALAAAIRQAGNVVSIGQIVYDAEHHTQSLVEPLPLLQDAGLAWGISGILRDEDVVARRILAYDHFVDNAYRHWGFELARAYWGDSAPAGISVPLIGKTDQQAVMLIAYPGPYGSFESVSAALVAEGKFPPGTFRDKIALVGPTSESLHDTYATPFSSEHLTPGVEIVAATVAMALEGHYLQAAPPWFSAALILAFLFLALLSTRIYNAQKMLWGSLGLAAAYIVLWYSLFLFGRIETPLVTPTLAILLVVGLPAGDSLLARQVRFRRVHATLNPLLTSAGDLDSLAGRLLPALGEHFQFAGVELLFRNSKRDQYIHPAATVPAAGLPADHPALSTCENRQPQTAPGAPLFVAIAAAFPDIVADVLFPLTNPEGLLAILCLRLAPGANRESELELLDLLAAPLALAFENAYLVEESKKQARTTRELEIARQIQYSFLPSSFPQSKHFQIAAYYLPARQVGGDFYDVISLPGGKFALVIADVSDKGVPAALFMALSRSYVRVYSNPSGKAFDMPSLEAVLQAVNDSLVEGNEKNMFVTLFYAVFDPQTCSLHYVNAGHNPPLLIEPGEGRASFISGKGLALGVFGGVNFEEHSLALERGQGIIFYTDGVTEARGPTGEIYGEERLVNAAAAGIGLEAEAAVTHIRRDLEAFVADAPQADDISLLVLKII